MSEIHKCKVGRLHDPKHDDVSFAAMEDAIHYAMVVSDRDKKEVIAIWFEDEPIYIFTAGLMFKIVTP
jgi:hypothetical protein